MIVDAALYADGSRTDVQLDDVEDLARCDRAGGFAWIGLRMPTGEELGAVCRSLGWHQLPFDQLVAPHSRPVLSLERDHLQLVLRTARYSDYREQVDLGELSVLLSADAIVTVRFGHATPLDGRRRALEADAEALRRGPGAVLGAVLAAVIADYGTVLDGFERDAVEVEGDVFTDSRRQPTKRLYHLKREIRRLLLAIGALEDPLARLLRSRTGLIDADTRDELEEAAEQLDRTVQRAASLSNLLDAALDASLAQISVQQNDDMRRISAWVAIASGPTLLAGIYGMNFDTFPELRWRFGYPLVIGVMLTIAVGLFRTFRRSGWL